MGTVSGAVALPELRTGYIRNRLRAGIRREKKRAVGVHQLRRKRTEGIGVDVFDQHGPRVGQFPQLLTVGAVIEGEEKRTADEGKVGRPLGQLCLIIYGRIEAGH